MLETCYENDTFGVWMVVVRAAWMPRVDARVAGRVDPAVGVSRHGRTVGGEELVGAVSSQQTVPDNWAGKQTGGTTPRPAAWPPVRTWLSLTLADLRLAWSMLYVRHGLWGMILLAVAAMTPAFLPPDLWVLDRFGLTWLEGGASRVLSTGLILGGVALLLHAWLRLRPGPGRPTAPTSTWFLWSLPLLLAPPLFSRDAYSYAAQGLIVDRGMDPFTTGPISVPGEFADNVDPVWLYTPAPYGPLALQMQHTVVDLTFGNAYVAAVAMRIPAVLSVAVLALVLPRLAARLGRSEQGARWLGVLNPLVLLHLVGGAHNDAVMIALVVLALWLAVDGRIAWAALTVAAAAGFKQTAIFALIAVAVFAARQAWGPAHTFTHYLREAVRVGLIALAGFTVLTAVSGLGWGWLHNLSVPMQMRSLLAPATLLGSIAQLLLDAMGAPGAAAAALPVMRTLGAVATIGAVLWLALRVGPKHPIGASAAAFAAFVVGGPVVQPWYVLPVLALLGATSASRRYVQAAVWLTIALVGYSAFDVAMSNGAALVGIVIIGYALWRLWRSRTDLVDEPLGDEPLAAGQIVPPAAEPAPARR